MNAVVPPLNQCIQFVVSAIPARIPPLLLAWARRLCSWGVPQESVAHFVFEMLFGTDDDGSGGGGRPDLHERILGAIIEENKDILTEALAELDQINAWNIWLTILDWVLRNHPSRANQLLPVLFAEHCGRPFTGLRQAQHSAQVWLNNNPPPPTRKIGRPT